MISNEIHVSNNYMGYHVSFKTIEESAFVKRELKLTDLCILETHLGRFNLIMSERQYRRFLNTLPTWEEKGLVRVQ